MHEPYNQKTTKRDYLGKASICGKSSALATLQFMCRRRTSEVYRTFTAG